MGDNSKSESWVWMVIGSCIACWIMVCLMGLVMPHLPPLYAQAKPCFSIAAFIIGGSYVTSKRRVTANILAVMGIVFLVGAIALACNEVYPNYQAESLADALSRFYAPLAGVVTGYTTVYRWMKDRL